MDFPTDVAEFDNDPRISFSRPDNSYLLETSDGREFLFNSILKRWVESVRGICITTLTLCDGLSIMLSIMPADRMLTSLATLDRRGAYSQAARIRL
jgi:hypothetical protein